MFAVPNVIRNANYRYYYEQGYRWVRNATVLDTSALITEFGESVVLGSPRNLASHGIGELVDHWHTSFGIFAIPNQTQAPVPVASARSHD